MPEYIFEVPDYSKKTTDYLLLEYARLYSLLDILSEAGLKDHNLYVEAKIQMKAIQAEAQRRDNA